MYNPNTEYIFPMRVIRDLQILRGQAWKTLVNSLLSPDVSEADRLGFVLFMVRTAGCITCNSDAFRAMKGCTQCAQQSIRRYRGDDSELVEQFEQAKQEVLNYLLKKEILFS